MANKNKKCKSCKEFCSVDDGMQTMRGFFCDYDTCMKGELAKIDERKKKKADVEFNRETKRMKAKVKPLSKALSEAQTVFNKYVRLRDYYLGCVSCRKPASWDGQWHASHFHSRGKSSFLRFNLWNVHKSCSVCNGHLSGNLRPYARKLKKKIGDEKLDWLEANASTSRKYDIEYLNRFKKIFAKRCRILEKRIET